MTKLVAMPRLACPRCSTHVTVEPGQTPMCPNCGHGAPPRPAPQTMQAQPWPTPPPHATPPPQWGAPAPQRTGPSQGIAIAALLVNILVLPGIGSLIGGRIGEGVTQLILALVAIPLMFVLIGFPLYFGVWIWGIVTGVQLLKEAERPPVYPAGAVPPY